MYSENKQKKVAEIPATFHHYDNPNVIELQISL
jgi:hypothetical protein